MQRLNFNTQDLAMDLTLTIKAPRQGAFVRLVGFDASKPNTTYFFLEQTIKRLKTLILPMPLSPSNLTVDIITSTHISIYDAKVSLIKSLKKERVNPDENTKSFIRHAFEFAEEAGYKETGNTYSNDAGEYPIHYFPFLANEHGQRAGTPARINKETGHIQVSTEDFVPYTIPMRMFILLHEWMHWHKDSGDETKCDIEAAKLFLGLGFPRYEALSAVTEVLSDHPNHIHRVETLQKFIQNYRD